MLQSLIDRLKFGLYVLVFLLIAYLAITSITQQAELSFWIGRFSLVTGSYQDALTKFDQAITTKCVGTIGPFDCSDRPDIPLDYFNYCVIAASRVSWKNIEDKKPYLEFYDKGKKCCEDAYSAAKKRNQLGAFEVFWRGRTQEELEIVGSLYPECFKPLKPWSLVSTPSPVPLSVTTPTRPMTPTLVSTSTSPVPTPLQAVSPIPTLLPMLFPDRLCTLPTYSPEQTVLLQEPIRESPSRGYFPFIFSKQQVELPIEGKKIICLASSPDGKGALKVDDQIEFQVTRAGKTAMWGHKFYDLVTGEIKPFSPQDVSGMFDSGTNEITLILSDLRQHVYSAEPVWLIIWRLHYP